MERGEYHIQNKERKREKQVGNVRLLFSAKQSKANFTRIIEANFISASSVGGNECGYTKEITLLGLPQEHVNMGMDGCTRFLGDEIGDGVKRTLIN